MIKPIYNFQIQEIIYEVYSQKPDFDLIKCNQTHSTDIFLRSDINDSTCGDGLWSPMPIKAMAVITADCLPVIFYGNKGCAIVHAGWRGLAEGILSHQTLKELKPSTIFIGPHISWDNYEVQSDFKKNFPQGLESFKQREDKLFFSLEKEARRQILDNYGPIVIESSNICTYNDSKLHSFRRNNTNQRNWNVIRMEKE